MGDDFDAPLKQVGKKSKNQWSQFVKEYSQQNNLKPKDAMKDIKKLGLYKQLLNDSNDLCL